MRTKYRISTKVIVNDTPPPPFTKLPTLYLLRGAGNKLLSERVEYNRIYTEIYCQR